MNNVDRQYQELIEYVLKNGNKKNDRTGTGTTSIFGYQMRFNLADGFPLLTTKKLHFKSIAIELLWFLSGSTNIKFLQDNGVKIWDSWVSEDKFIGKTYGYQWTNWDFCINQIEELIDGLKNNPDSRRHLVTAWNPSDNKRLVLPPCHYSFQMYVKTLDVHERLEYCDFMYDKSTWDKLHLESDLGWWHDNESEEYKTEWRNKATEILDNMNIPKANLSCLFNMRSTDIFLGLPFNIASYALLTHMIAQQCNLAVGELIWSGGDVHIYGNHIDQVKEQLTRKPYELPALNIKRKPESIFDYNYDDFEVLNYNAHPNIKGKVAV